MIERLEQFFTQDPRKEQEYSDFEKRYRDDPNAISDEEAARRYREMMSQVDDDEDPVEASEYQRAFGNLTEEQRRDLARRYQEADKDPGRPFDGFREGEDVEEASSPEELGRLTRRAAKKDPDLLEQLMGSDSPLTSRAGRMALAGVAAFMASRFLGKKR